MGFFAEKRATVENPSIPLGRATRMLLNAWGGESRAGVDVSPASAMTLSSVFGCVRIIAESLGMLRAGVHEQQGEAVIPKRDDPRYQMVFRTPNDEVIAPPFWEALTANALLWGRGIAEIEFTAGMEPVALWPIHPSRVTLTRIPDGDPNGELGYIIRLPRGGERVLPAFRILHLPGFAGDLSIINAARQAIGLGIAQETSASTFLAHGSRLGGVLQTPMSLTPEAARRLEEDFEDRHKGLERAHRVAVLEEGMKWTATSVPPEDAQFLESRVYQVAEVARFFRMQLHKLQELKHATFTNIEHQSREHVTDTLRPWAVRWELELGKKLLKPAERSRMFFRVDFKPLIQGDSDSQARVFATGRQWGWFSTNYILGELGINPIDGGDDDHILPVNYVLRRDLIDGTAGGGAPPGFGGDRDKRIDAARTVLNYEGGKDPRREVRQRQAASMRLRLRGTFKELIRSNAERLVRREVNDLKRAAGSRLERDRALQSRDIADFMSYLSGFYRDFPEVVAKTMGPTIRAYAEQVNELVGLELGDDDPKFGREIEQFGEDYTNTFAGVHSRDSERELRAKLAESTGAEAAEVVAGVLARWDERRAGGIAERQVVKAGEAVARRSYQVGGVQSLVWRTTGDSCPLCNEMDGRQASIGSAFMGENETLDPEDGKTAPLVASRQILHAPLHRGCDCMVVPAL